MEYYDAMSDPRIASTLQTISLFLLGFISSALLLLNRLIWIAGLSAVASDAESTFSIALKIADSAPWWVWATGMVVFFGTLVWKHYKAVSILYDYKKCSKRVDSISAEMITYKKDVFTRHIENKRRILAVAEALTIERELKPYIIKRRQSLLDAREKLNEITPEMVERDIMVERAIRVAQDGVVVDSSLDELANRITGVTERKVAHESQHIDPKCKTAIDSILRQIQKCDDQLKFLTNKPMYSTLTAEIGSANFPRR
jgi:hypothetical protein